MKYLTAKGPVEYPNVVMPAEIPVQAANENLCNLGHLSIYFGSYEGDEVLPGAILVEENVVPVLKIGDIIRIS